MLILVKKIQSEVLLQYSILFDTIHRHAILKIINRAFLSGLLFYPEVFAIHALKVPRKALKTPLTSLIGPVKVNADEASLTFPVLG